MNPRFFITLIGCLFTIIFSILIGVYMKQKKTDKKEYKAFIGFLVCGVVTMSVGLVLYGRYAGETVAFKTVPQLRAVNAVASRFGYTGGNLMNMRRKYF